MPRQIRAALEAFVCRIEVLIVEVGCVHQAGRKPALVTSEKAARDRALLVIVEVVIAGSRREGEHLGNDVEIQRGEERALPVSAFHVIEEAHVVTAHRGRVVDARAGSRPYVRHAPDRDGRGARRQGLVEPVQLVVNAQVFPERADDAAQTPLIWRAEPNLVALVRVALRLGPDGARREAGRSEAVCRFGTMALVIVRVQAARIVGVVLHRAHVAHQVRARVDRPQRADSPVDRQGRVLELVLVVGVVEQRDRLPGQRCAVRALRHLVEHAFGIHVLIALGDEGVPLIVDVPESGYADALVGHRIDRILRERVVVDRRSARRDLARRSRGPAA